MLAIGVVGASGVRATEESTPAKELFGRVHAPAPPMPGSIRAIGLPARGCLAGAVALPPDGPYWQAMRPSRNRRFGHPRLIALIERLAREARGDGWPGLLVGDLAQPRGGPMLSGHASHQTGLDADIWLSPSPERRLSEEERETLPAPSVLREGTRTVDPERFGPAHIALIRRAASYPEVARIFVHPGIKQVLCAVAGADRAWLSKIRPWWGHDSHFHLRLRCPENEPLCRDQEPPPEDDGCGAELAWWLSEEPWRPKPPTPPPPPLTLRELPPECRSVLRAPRRRERKAASGSRPRVAHSGSSLVGARLGELADQDEDVDDTEQEQEKPRQVQSAVLGVGGDEQS
ncbi:MAG: penicillin-insensitive murein endopeptidase [Geminicoccaceae bacterium]|nr:penicillin-insensitive murein endopeptidase [Geminicoccaceae bacterium]MCS7267046.1 penicillin-insensitive murein endopeptidase [Geminicoccaceae bacterium]MDW8125426.1 penicillin-insensitive murein endopeptidase [Geminicoccaceae bacterium]MDW8342252.1 penicillin-insensitive murein endopeptidase [Geminicoccaceae bacterium]